MSSEVIAEPLVAEPNSASERRTRFWVRLATGLVQGAALWAVTYGWEHQLWGVTRTPYWSAPLFLVAALVPAVVLAGVGRIKARHLALWTLVAAAVLALIAVYSVMGQTTVNRTSPYLPVSLILFSAAALFIAHHLLVPALVARRRVAPYPAYFDATWKSGVQLMLSLGFTGVFFILLHLGAGLFGLIGVNALTALIAQDWFSIPAASLAFAAAVHLTDVKEGLIRGVRTVALMLMSWLLPVIVVLTACFLLALPFTGLTRLWNAGSATGLVLSVAAVLVILINATYQDGSEDASPHIVLRWAARIGGVLLLPLTLLAAWGLALRIGQHGLTPDRIVAVALLIMSAVYAAGYLSAALKRGRWMARLETTNLVAAVTAVGLILALYSPLANPIRLSIAEQTWRLERGAVSPAQFDFDFLRFDSGRRGVKALERLKQSRNPDIARAADEALKRNLRTDALIEIPLQPLRLAAIAGQNLPDGFAASAADTPSLSNACRGVSRDERPTCTVRLVDLNGDGKDDALVATPFSLIAMIQRDDGRWNQVGNYTSCNASPPSNLTSPLDRPLKVLPATLPDLELDGQRLTPWVSGACNGKG